MNSKPSISVIIPVLNEAQGINDFITHIRSQAAVDAVEIIVVDGDPAGSTIRAISHPGIITAVAEKGRGSQMNCGAIRATGLILLFLHADTFLPPNAFACIRKCMEVTAMWRRLRPGIDSGRKIFRITERYVAWRTRHTRIPFGDQAIFIRRDYFDRIGGYRHIPIMEDVDLMRRIRQRGDAICVVPEKVMTSARRWDRDGIVFGTLRNWMLQALYCCGVAPERLARFYR
jgi:rSAM/selenodomain-associated transferase 2